MCYETRKRIRRPTSRVRARGRRHSRRAGLTLIEIMVVVVILGMLAGAVSLKVVDYIDDAKVERVRSDIATIVDAVEGHKLKHGRYPTNDEGLEELPLRNRLDPWGEPYIYNRPGPDDEPFEIISFGEDGSSGGEGADADIYSWQIDAAREDDR